ncbi:fumarylacetoacetate hydrolase family protein [Hephaestia caeni]|nr:fumarylacetoacetate hydrolase family protein [Hephaestia caeni]
MASNAVLLPPAEPRTILGLAGAYVDPAGDLPPTIRWFAKSASAAATDGDEVAIPSVLSSLKVEAELVLVIGKRVKEADVAESGAAIFGYAVGTEIFGSAEDYREITGDNPGREEQMLAAGLKLGDKFAPFGPCIHAGVDWRRRDRSLVIRDASGKVRVQYRNSTDGLRRSPAQIVADLSKIMTLEPGDVIFTGTTEAFVVHPGETVVTSITGLGTLSNAIVRPQTGGNRE